MKEGGLSTALALAAFGNQLGVSQESLGREGALSALSTAISTYLGR